MKTLKYRLVKYSNGRYTIQYKNWLWWTEFDEYLQTSYVKVAVSKRNPVKLVRKLRKQFDCRKLKMIQYPTLKITIQ